MTECVDRANDWCGSGFSTRICREHSRQSAATTRVVLSLVRGKTHRRPDGVDRTDKTDSKESRAELVLPRLPKRLPRAVFSISEVERVLAQADVNTMLGLRDRAVMELLYSTGIRRMELVGLDFADLDVERAALFIREGKGRKDRIVPIGQRAIRWTSRYLE